MLDDKEASLARRKARDQRSAMFLVAAASVEFPVSAIPNPGRDAGFLRKLLTRRLCGTSIAADHAYFKGPLKGNRTVMLLKNETFYKTSCYSSFSQRNVDIDH